MATIKKMTNKAGEEYYKIWVSRGRDKGKVVRNWPIPKGLKASTVQARLNKFVADLEREVSSGEITNREEHKKAEAEAAALAAAEEAKIQTVQQYGEKVFLANLAVHAAENTRDTYDRYLRLHIYPVLGSVKMPDVTSAQITALLVKFQAAGHAVASCVKVYTILQGLFKSAYLDDSIPRNPMDKVQRPKASKDELKNAGPEFFSLEELQKIFACLKNEPLKWQVYVTLLATTGIRRGEAGGLTWECVDLKNRLIWIKQTVNYTKEKGTYISTPKSKQIRQVPITEDMAKLFEAWRQQQARECLSPYVFTQTKAREIMQAQSPTGYFDSFGDRYGIEGFHPHKLRHSYASICLQNGADIVSVSALLGHADPAITLRVYSHTDEDGKRAAANIFSNALAGSLEKKTKQA